MTAESFSLRYQPILAVMPPEDLRRLCEILIHKEGRLVERMARACIPGFSDAALDAMDKAFLTATHGKEVETL